MRAAQSPARSVHFWGPWLTARDPAARLLRRRGLEMTVPMIELTAAKGGNVWVNPAQLQYVALPDAAASSMYGDNNSRTGSRLYFAQGGHLDVRESPADVVALLNA